ncbi:hypothetical protein SLAV_18255 [Streptomyces lavendulae subsp. lavendulae]|uniref:Uncharacterized protein n=1 Tax=Streptomyces lavendulae subsp. lavendulae TaxID=58340 RepID=A0A2K8PG74_STRLA|nr:hypothetical protein [Streptomyces lavendulae]ATZ25488.1 hypothetical protein SLAV_18255 [Streptomyces lavendulae subsp. lavendulae]QUQ55316.1 hypothetical protein SLLC_16340 [Streptomyces lavendulae subsp. lavendulae]
MSRRRRVWCLLAAVLTTLLATVAPTASAAPTQVTSTHATPTHATPTHATPAHATPAQAAPAFGSVVMAGVQEQGPRCAPDGPERGGVPVVPPRSGCEHAQLPAGGVVPGEVRPRGTAPLRVLVRGPDRTPPGPVELSVLRV